MRDLDEVGLPHDADEFLAQAVIGRLEILRRAAGMRIDLRIEEKIRLAQPVELLEILVMQDGAEHARKLPQPGLPGLIQLCLRDEAADDVRLPQRNDAVRLRRRGSPGLPGRGAVHETLAGAVRTPQIILPP